MSGDQEGRPLIIVTRICYNLCPVLLYILAISKTPVTPFISERTDSSIPPNSFQTIEQAEQAYLNFQADLLPARSSSAQAFDSPSTPSSTPLLILLPRPEIDKI